MPQSRQPKRYPWSILLAALVALALGVGGVSWCGSGEAPDPGWNKSGDVKVPTERGPYEYGDEDGGTNATKEGP